ncbi:MAG: TraR/DksA family transcriptional regulator [Acidobacteriota bacterium]
MDKNRLETFRALLLEKLQDLHSAVQEKRLEQMQGFEENEADLYDLSAQSYSKEQLYLLCEREQLLAAEVKVALRKIDDRTFGFCEECGEIINEKRLTALPWVRSCIRCQTEMEDGRAA